MQPDPALDNTWNKLVVPLSNDTKGYTVWTTETITHTKGHLVYGKHIAVAAAARNMVQKLEEQSTGNDEVLAQAASAKIGKLFDVTSIWKKSPALPIELTAEVADLMTAFGLVAKHPCNVEYVHKIG